MTELSSRRKMIKQIAAGTIAFGAFTQLPLVGSAADDKKLKGRINHSVCWWTYNYMPLEELCKTVKKIGFKAIDLVGPANWETLKKHGIHSSMCNGAEIGLT